MSLRLELSSFGWMATPSGGHNIFCSAIRMGQTAHFLLETKLGPRALSSAALTVWKGLWFERALLSTSPEASPATML